MLVAVSGGPRRDGSPLLRVLLIVLGVLLVLAVTVGLCAKCREHMACCAEGDDGCCAEDQDREGVQEQDEDTGEQPESV